MQLPWVIVRSAHYHELLASERGLSAQVPAERQRAEHLQERLASLKTLLQEAQLRAGTAEAIARQQAGIIDRLDGSTARLTTLVTEMRRAGFVAPAEIDTSPNDEISSVDDDDREWVKKNPEMAVGGWD